MNKTYNIGDEIVSINCKWGIIIQCINEYTFIVLDEDGKEVEVNDNQVLSHKKISYKRSWRK